MSIKRLMTMNCLYEELIDNGENEYGLEYSNYKEPETLKCFKYDNGGTFGKTSFDIKENGEEINNSTKTYNIIDERIKEGDRLDGRLVRAVDTHYNFKGKFSHKTCAVI